MTCTKERQKNVKKECETLFFTATNKKHLWCSKNFTSPLGDNQLCKM